MKTLEVYVIPYRHFYQFNYKRVIPIRTALISVFIISALGASTAYSQDITDVDAAFQEARELAFDGNYSKSKEISRQILSQEPDYHDVRILLARTYAWDQNYREARTQLSYVLEREPDYVDALSARVDVEQWSGNFQVALQFANHAIALDSKSADLHIKRAVILKELNQYSLALENLETAENLGADPDDTGAIRETIQSDERRNMVVFGISRDDYNVDFDSRERIYVEYHRLTDFGPIIGRLNVDHRFDTTGYQFELDAYPRISSKWYSYLNAGYSNSILFPEWRAGAELYRELPWASEGSIGLRYLKFTDDDVLIYTGSLSKYWRDWFFSIRPFVTPQNGNISTAVNFIARRYFGNPETYTSLVGGFGFSPDERRLIDGSIDDRFSESYYVGVIGNRKFRERFQLFGEFRWTFQELQAFPDFSQIYTFETGIRYRF